MMKRALTFLTLLFLAGQMYGQQEPMFTKYMFNSLIFNPGYAGSSEFLSVGLLHRSQWYEIDGAPTTQTFTAHTPLRNERVGVGFSLINDVIGPSQTIGANFSYAYRLPLGKKLKLSVGLQGGIESYTADWSELNIDQELDPSFQTNVSKLLPNFGAGFYLYSDKFYIGGSVPHLVEYDLREEQNLEIYARQIRHYYFMAGAVFPLQGDALMFKPSILLKNVGWDKRASKLDAFRDIGAPVEYDIDLSLLFQQTLWVGVSFRSTFAQTFQSTSSHDSADIWVSYLLKNGMRIGAAYDYPLSDLSQVTAGAFEIMIGKDFNFNERKVVTPRYF